MIVSCFWFSAHYKVGMRSLCTSGSAAAVCARWSWTQTPSKASITQRTVSQIARCRFEMMRRCYHNNLFLMDLVACTLCVKFKIFDDLHIFQSPFKRKWSKTENVQSTHPLVLCEILKHGVLFYYHHQDLKNLSWKLFIENCKLQADKIIHYY